MAYRVFISYAHRDAEYKEELERFLRPLERDGLIEPWSDRLIEVGADWQAAIADAMAACHLGLFLVSPDFQASEFIHSQEMTTLMQRVAQDRIEVIPILLRPCDWQREPYGHLQPLPAFEQFIADQQGTDGDRAWQKVKDTIRERAEAHAAAQSPPAPQWSEPPFPGLRSFAVDEGPIFFGRQDETAALKAKIEAGTPFLAVHGASGTGKSSVVKAGLLYKLREASTAGEQMPLIVMAPDEDGDGNPFTPLCTGLQSWLGPAAPQRKQLKQRLGEDPANIHGYVDEILQRAPADTELILAVDQFEELFTLIHEAQRAPFADVLDALADHPRARVVLTVRSDFYHRFADHPPLIRRLNDNGTYLLQALEPEQYREMIEEPARLAGFTFEQGLAKRLVNDARQGGRPEGMVPLLAFALDRLYKPFAERRKAGEAIADPRFTHEAYEAMGGLQGTVEAAADAALEGLDGAQRALERSVPQLVSVALEGTPTRRRATRSQLEAADAVAGALVERLVAGRLLVADEGHVEVAHEILFQAWPALRQAIETYRQELQLRERMRYEAQQWAQGGRRERMPLMYHEQQQALYRALAALGEPREQWTEEPERSFLLPEAERLLAELESDETPHPRRAEIGLRLDEIGDPRSGVGLRWLEVGDEHAPLPEIEWHEVPAGEIPGWYELEEGWLAWKPLASPWPVAAFRIARYPVTVAQYRAFKDAPDGYANDDWWAGLARPALQLPATGAGDNHPMMLVDWYEAVAFCRWLDARLREAGVIGADEQLRLPFEWEWQHAASWAPDTGRHYEWPWGDEWDARRANTQESELMRTVAAGLYPRGGAPCGALDMAGNVDEWCLNAHDAPTEQMPEDAGRRALRGGSWFDNRPLARAAFRYGLHPGGRNVDVGFRVCVASPIVDH